MSETVFKLVRKGYAVEQVDAYISHLQEAYVKTESIIKEYEEEEEHLSELIAEKTKVNDIDTYKDNTEKRKLIDSINSIETETDDITKQIRCMEQDLSKTKVMLEQKTKITKENIDYKRKINGLKDKLALLKAKNIDNEQKRKQRAESSSDSFKGILKLAEGQADVYLKSIEEQTLKDKEHMLEEAKNRLGEAAKFADKIKNDAIAESIKNAEIKMKQLDTERNDINKAGEDAFAEYEYMKKEVELERKNIEEEAKAKIRRTKEKYKIAKEKEDVVTYKTIEEIKNLGREMIADYYKMQNDLINTVEDVQSVFAAPEVTKQEAGNKAS